MSFLNPVNEPVLRFSSTDSDAPQINYNSRTAGDVKAVLKACLVTGYGDKTSAGWSIVNEVDHVAEFVSPSAAMSDYRLGIDDTSTSSTTWYYQYQDVRVNPSDNKPIKNIYYIDSANTGNGWEVLVTEQGFLLIEKMYSTASTAITARATYYGRVKSAIADANGKNIGFWCVGYDAPVTYPGDFFDPTSTRYKHFVLGDYASNIQLAGTTLNVATSSGPLKNSTINLVADIYLMERNNAIIGRQPGCLVQDINNTVDLYGVYDTVVNGRDMLYASLGARSASSSILAARSRGLVIPLDFWEY